MHDQVKFNIILFWFMNDWGLYGRAYEKIAENLASLPEVERVICVFPPVEVPPVAPLFKIREYGSKLIVAIQKCGFLRLDRRPYRLRKFVNQMVSKLLLAVLVRKLGVRRENTLLWLYPHHPFIDDILSKVPHDFIVTQIVDNNTFIEGFDEKDKMRVESQYTKLAKISDAMIISSQINYEIFSKINPHCRLFQNAVDSKFISEPSVLPHRNTQGRVKLGYVGFISERTDLKLMKYIAERRTEYDLLIAGPINSRINMNEHGLLELPNVHYLGVLQYVDVPAFLSSVDVCLIPHKDTLYSKSMSPLKLFQYLGSGRPIVSTSIAGVEPFKNIIAIAKNYQDFLELIDDSIVNDNVNLSKKRIEVAKNEVWEKRVQDIFKYVHEIILSKSRENAYDAG